MGFSSQELSTAIERVARVTGIRLPIDLSVRHGSGLTVSFSKSDASIVAEDINALSRGVFLLTRAVREGRSTLEVRQERHIANCGAMLDMSRNGVMTVDAVKRMIDMHAALGLNMLMLYTEDTYEVPGYPYFGYLRGRYTQSELREMDDYAEGAGVELVPCIQTLGHLAQFLQWDDSSALHDQMDILLIDDERTYDLIRAAIASLRSCMRSGRIHIGMDEAHGVGLGRYLEKNGVTDRFALLSRHLDRVTQICREYGFAPMMWSDMFFRLGSKTNSYYDLEAEIPRQVIDTMPDVGLVYWDYYHRQEEFYDRMLTLHERFGRETVFAGGVWTWSGFLPQVKQTEATMRPALKVCARHHVQTAIATMWGDDGAETNAFLASPLLSIFSEACWQGADHPLSEDVLAGECLTGVPRAVLEAFGDFYPDGADHRPGKALVWGDPLYPLLNLRGEAADDVIDRSRCAQRVLADHADLPGVRYASLLHRIVQEKAAICRDVRERYLEGDRAYLTTLAHETIPRLLGLYDELMREHRRLWTRDYKRQGWEVLAGRYGYVTGRLRDVADELDEYLSGELRQIAALEEMPLPAGRYAGEHFAQCVTPSANT